MKTIDLTPSWTTAVRIYVGCLLNPKASEGAHEEAEKDLLNLARNYMDKCDDCAELLEVNTELRKQMSHMQLYRSAVIRENTALIEKNTQLISEINHIEGMKL